MTQCDIKAMEQFSQQLKRTVKEIKEFYNYFIESLDQQKKLSKDLWSLVTRYNILNAGTPCIYPIIQKEELLEELLTSIQDKSTVIFRSLVIVQERYNNLPKSNKVLEALSLCLNWDPKTNPLIKGSVKHRPATEYLEDIADIVFQFDVAITCIFQYFDALNLHDAKSYNNLMNSIKIAPEIVDLVNEFLIKSASLHN